MMMVRGLSWTTLISALDFRLPAAWAFARILWTAAITSCCCLRYTSLSRRCAMPIGQKPIVRFGPFELDPQCAEVRQDGVRLKLQGQPIQILEMLLSKPGQLVTREEIQERLWPADTFVDFDHS